MGVAHHTTIGHLCDDNRLAALAARPDLRPMPVMVATFHYLAPLRPGDLVRCVGSYFAGPGSVRAEYELDRDGALVATATYTLRGSL